VNSSNTSESWKPRLSQWLLCVWA